MKRTIQSAIVGLAIFTLAESSEAAIYNTSFEAGEGYSEADLIGQNGWVAGFTAATGMSVIDAADDSLVAPNGTRVAKLIRGAGSSGSVRASHSLDTDNIALATPFTITTYMAYDEIGTNGTSAYTTLDSGTGTFNGVQFGFNKSGTDTYLQYRNGSTWTNVPGQSGPALERMFYRFVVSVRPADAQYDLSVYEMDGDLVGSVTNAARRGSVASYSYMNVTNLDDENDLMWFDMEVVPEPSAGLAPAALAALAFARRRR